MIPVPLPNVDASHLGDDGTPAGLPDMDVPRRLGVNVYSAADMAALEHGWRDGSGGSESEEEDSDSSMLSDHEPDEDEGFDELDAELDPMLEAERLQGLLRRRSISSPAPAMAPSSPRPGPPSALTFAQLATAVAEEHRPVCRGATTSRNADEACEYSDMLQAFSQQLHRSLDTHFAESQHLPRQAYSVSDSVATLLLRPATPPTADARREIVSAIDRFLVVQRAVSTDVLQASDMDSSLQHLRRLLQGLNSVRAWTRDNGLEILQRIYRTAHSGIAVASAQASAPATWRPAERIVRSVFAPLSDFAQLGQAPRRRREVRQDRATMLRQMLSSDMLALPPAKAELVDDERTTFLRLADRPTADLRCRYALLRYLNGLLLCVLPLMSSAKATHSWEIGYKLRSLSHTIFYPIKAHQLQVCVVMKAQEVQQV